MVSPVFGKMSLLVSYYRLLFVYVILVAAVILLVVEIAQHESTVNAFGLGGATFVGKSTNPITTTMTVHSPNAAAKQIVCAGTVGMVRTMTLLQSYNNNRMVLPTTMQWSNRKRNRMDYTLHNQHQLKRTWTNQCARATITTITTLQLAQQQDVVPAPPSQQYLLKYTYIPDVLEKRGPYREEHLKVARQLVSDGMCLFGGPTSSVSSPTIPTGALFVFTTETAAQQFVNTDPYVANGIVTSHTIEEWNVLISK